MVVFIVYFIISMCMLSLVPLRSSVEGNMACRWIYIQAVMMYVMVVGFNTSMMLNIGKDCDHLN
jgi:hypothetical protein